MVVQRNAITPPRPASLTVVKAESLQRDLLRCLDDIQNCTEVAPNGDDPSSISDFRDSLPQVAVLGAEVKQIHMALHTAQRDGHARAQPILQMLEAAKADKTAAEKKLENLNKRFAECEPVKSLKIESLGLDLPKLDPNADNREKIRHHQKLVEALKEEDEKRKELTRKLETLRKKKNDGLSALKTKGLTIKAFPRRVNDIVEAAEKLRQYCKPTVDSTKK